MPETLFINDFSQGWCPSDDPISGRKNGLLKMDAVELDQNGALRLSGGQKVIRSYAAMAHTLYAKYLNVQQYRYIALVDGSVYRDGTLIISGGSASRAAFGAAFDYVLIASGAKRVRDDGTTITNLGIEVPAAAPVVAVIGGGPLTGDYYYYQVNLKVNNSYQARSAPGPISLIASTAGSSVNVTPEVPADPTITLVEIYRIGGGLDKPYRVHSQIPSSGLFNDSVTDQAAIDEGVVLNLLTASVNSVGLPQDILEIVGPVNGRILYFTPTNINFSEVNSPDSYTPGQSIAFAGGAGTAEIFLWARKLGRSTVLVGTTRDVYILTGTYITLPDGTLDVYLQHLGVESPPLSRDVDTYSGNVIFMTGSGWKVTSTDGVQINLIDDRTDRLYRGETLQGYGGIPIQLLPQIRYGIAVVKDKVYVIVPQIVNNDITQPFTYRACVFDFKRKYWRPLPGNAPSLFFGDEDDKVTAFFNADETLRTFDDQTTKLIAGTASSVKQNVNVLTSIFDHGKPRQRKDSYTLKLKCSTGGDDLTVQIYTNDGNSLELTTTVNSSSLTEIDININELTKTKNYQLALSGQVADLLISDISIDFDVRPIPTAHQRFISVLGSASKKRVRTWPFFLDTLGANVLVTPTVDGTVYPTSTFNGTGEKVYNHQFTDDVFGNVYEFELNSEGVFELYEQLQPEVVQVLPVTKRFDQVGPIELFRHGKLRQLELRVLALGTSIPYEVFFEDGSSEVGSLDTLNGIETSYKISLQKFVAGTILRITLGPTAFDFHRYYMRALVSRSGKDTDNEWLTVDGMPQQ